MAQDFPFDFGSILLSLQNHTYFDNSVAFESRLFLNVCLCLHQRILNSDSHKPIYERVDIFWDFHSCFIYCGFFSAISVERTIGLIPAIAWWRYLWGWVCPRKYTLIDRLHVGRAAKVFLCYSILLFKIPLMIKRGNKL